MTHCQSCGGIIGQDCFNPDECALITQQMENQRQHEQEHRIKCLETKIQELEELIKQKAAQ